MPKLKPAKPDEVKRVLEKSGFSCIRQSGSLLFITMLMADGQQFRYTKAEI